MKKFLIVLGMLTCLLGMTACSGKQQEAEGEVMQLDETRAISYADGLVESLNGVVADGMQDQYSTDPIISAALTGWENAIKEIGSVEGTADHVITGAVGSATIELTVKGSDHDAQVIITLAEDGSLSAITTNVIKSFGELMTNAALNTLLGMGTVFIVLILISLLIACFKFIPAWQAKFSRKKEVVEPVVAAPVAQEILEQPQEDDCELIAVIAAAIAASEGAQSTDGFVVRSIRRRSGKWQNA